MLSLILYKTYKNKDYTKQSLPKVKYDNCTFVRGDFEVNYLSNISFIACEFVSCNLSNTKLKEATLKDTIFTDCEMLGMPLYEVNPYLLSIVINNCILDFANFTGLKLSKTTFMNCSLQQTDFTKCNLSQSNFSNTKLKNTIFEQTNLEGTNFIPAYNFSFWPENNSLKGVKFSKYNIEDLLTAHQITIH